MQVEQASFIINEQTIRLPVLIPDIHLIRSFAQMLHMNERKWSDMYEGWPASYTPEDCTRQPANSSMDFTPAEFFIGESDIWHVSIAWEDGRDQAPVELENRRGIGGESRVSYLALQHGQHILR